MGVRVRNLRKHVWFAVWILGGATGVFVSGCGPSDLPLDAWLDEHVDITMASTLPGGGALAVEYDFSRVVELPFLQCIGGSGPACDGGIVLYGAESPGFAPLESDRRADSLYVLRDGTPVVLELVSATEGASLFFAGTSLSRAGDAVLIGQAREGLHRHGSWQIAIPAGEPVAETYSLTFRLTSPSPSYEPSEIYTLTLRPRGGPQ